MFCVVRIFLYPGGLLPLLTGTAAGNYRVIFDAFNLSNGIYFCRIKMKNFMDIKIWLCWNKELLKRLNLELKTVKPNLDKPEPKR